MALVRARRRSRAAPAAVSGRTLDTAVSVDDEERRRLIECCAFFRVQRFRDAQPGRYRDEDLRSAASAIDSVIRPVRKRKQR